MKIEKASGFSRISVILSLIVLITTTQGRGQPYHFDHLNTNDGLSQNSVWAITKDSKGFMWFGTDDGLNRYDGYEFITYRNNPYDSLSISSNAITNIFQDSKNRLWIGTKNGLNLYNSKNNSFRSFYSDDGDYANLIKTLCEDDMKGIWIGTGKGLKVIDSASHKLVPFKTTIKNASILDFTIRNLIYDHNFWIATDSGLVNFDEKKDLLHIYKPYPSNTPKNRLTSLNLYQNNIWAGSFENGFYIFDRKTKTFTSYSHNDSDNNTVVSNEVTKAIIIHGKAWICTPFGLSIFDPVTKKFQNLVHDQQEPTSLSTSALAEALEDDQGIIWLGSRAGINIFSGNSYKFKHFKQNAGSANTLAENIVGAITQNDQGDILIATDGGGVSIFNPQTKKFTTLMHNPDNPNSQEIKFSRC